MKNEIIEILKECGVDSELHKILTQKILSLKQKRGRIKNCLYNVDSFMIANGKAGDVFYTEKEDKHITAIASSHQRKVQTERLITVTLNTKPSAVRITKVVLL